MKARASTRMEILRESFWRLCEAAPELGYPAGRRHLLLVVVAGMCSLVPVCLWVRGHPWRAPLVELAYLLWCGRYMVWGFFRQRDGYRAAYDDRAYAHLYRVFLMPFAAGAGPVLVFPALVGGPPWLWPPLAWLGAAYLLATAKLMEDRAPRIFWDIELRGFVFTVFPDRGGVIESGLYEYLRHPIYSSVARFVLGLALLRNNLPAVVCAALLGGGLWLLSRVEEDDLERAQPRYGEYRRSTPGFVARRPREFFRYLLKGEEA